MDASPAREATGEAMGFDSYVDDLSSVGSKGVSDETCEVLVRINKRSPYFVGGFHVGKDEKDVGTGDLGTMFGYASGEMKDCMSLAHSMATRLGTKLTDDRKEMNKLIVEKVVGKAMQEIILKNGKPAISLYGAHAPGRRRAHRLQDHHRHLWQLGCAWCWHLLRQGPHQGGQVRSSTHLQADGQVWREGRAVRTAELRVAGEVAAAEPERLLWSSRMRLRKWAAAKGRRGKAACAHRCSIIHCLPALPKRACSVSS